MIRPSGRRRRGGGARLQRPGEPTARPRRTRAASARLSASRAWNRSSTGSPARNSSRAVLLAITGTPHAAASYTTLSSVSLSRGWVALRSASEARSLAGISSRASGGSIRTRSRRTSDSGDNRLQLAPVRLLVLGQLRAADLELRVEPPLRRELERSEHRVVALPARRPAQGEEPKRALGRRILRRREAGRRRSRVRSRAASRSRAGTSRRSTLRTTSTSGVASRSDRPACQCVYQRRSGTRSSFVSGAASSTKSGTMCTSTAAGRCRAAAARPPRRAQNRRRGRGACARRRSGSDVAGQVVTAPTESQRT